MRCRCKRIMKSVHVENFCIFISRNFCILYRSSVCTWYILHTSASWVLQLVITWKACKSRASTILVEMRILTCDLRPAAFARAKWLQSEAGALIRCTKYGQTPRSSVSLSYICFCLSVLFSQCVLRCSFVLFRSFGSGLKTLVWANFFSLLLWFHSYLYFTFRANNH